MRTKALLSLCVVLAACTAQRIRVENPAFTPKSPGYTAQPMVSDLLDSSAPLYMWNETQSRYEIHIIDLSTGQDVPGYTPVVVGASEFIGSNTLSPNGQKLAIVAANGEYCYPSGGGTACTGRADVLHIIDLGDWEEVTATFSNKGWTGPISFSPDITQLALIFNDPKSSTVMLFDAGTGAIIAEHPIAFHASLMEFTSDDTTLMLYGQSLGSDTGISKPDAPRVVFLDTRTLDVKWEQQLTNIVSGYWCNGQPIIPASQSGHSITRLAVLDPVTFDILRSWSLPTSYASWISIP